MRTEHTYFATCPLGLEAVLAGELSALGAHDIQEEIAGVAFTGPLATGYRACIWLRSASRVLLELARFSAPTPEALYEGVQSIDWSTHLDVQQTFAVDFTTTRSAITHTNFGALKAKDAIVDQFRDSRGVRPSVDRQDPGLQINVHVRDNQAVVNLNLSGISLHRRTWRHGAGSAPLKENLAAGILLLAGWPEAAASERPLLDPMCGAGTLPIEAALMAADVAPGLMRERFGFEGWLLHDTELAETLLAEARERDQRGRGQLPPIMGFDASHRMVRTATANAQLAGVNAQVRFERRELAMVDAGGHPAGLLVANPPYGERLGVKESLGALYNRIGMTLKGRFKGWDGYVMTGDRELAKSLGLRVARRHILFNGAIECRLLHIPVLPPKSEDGVTVSPRDAAQNEASLMLANRVRKNLKKMRGWCKQQKVTCYRVYDSDLSEFPMSVEVYEDWLHVQENERPADIDPLRAEARLHGALSTLSEVFDIPAERIFVKQRGRKRGTSQYVKFDDARSYVEVHEGGLTFLANPTDYFDTGLFLDHRPTRAMIKELASGRRFLNLFAYTGTASVYAAAGGATSTTTVDLSQTYVDWAQRNMALNGFEEPRHTYQRNDVLQWLSREKGRYGLIFLDPPTFSNSKAMKRTLDVQEDHAWLLNHTARLLSPDGVIIFSTNFRKFKLDSTALQNLVVEDISRKTIPPDFQRNPKIHYCWKVSRK